MSVKDQVAGGWDGVKWLPAAGIRPTTRFCPLSGGRWRDLPRRGQNKQI